MSLIALLIDLVAIGSYFLQARIPSSALYTLGLIVQVILTLFLVIFIFSYPKRRFGHFFNFDTWSRPFTIRYGFIVFSAIFNAIVAFLYYLNITGRNPLIFGTP